MKKGHTVYNCRTKKREKITRLIRLHADSREDVDILHAGEIGACAGMRQPGTGDTLCVENAQIEFGSMRFPEPVMFMAVEPKSSADRDKVEEALLAMASEDPTCVIRTDAETGQKIMSGMGELHLEILKDRMLREYKVVVKTGKPMVAYYETATKSGEGECEFDKEIAGHRQYAKVRVSVEPRERTSGNHVDFSAGKNFIPEEFRSAVSEGINDGITTGVLARYPVTDIEVKVIGGGFDPDNSTEVAFRSAALMAFREAFSKAGAVLLEPVMELEIIVPSEHVGDVVGDLNGRRGKVLDMSVRGESRVITAGVPLAELFGYSTAMRSLTRGRGSYSMEPKELEVAPELVLQEILKR